MVKVVTTAHRVSNCSNSTSHIHRSNQTMDHTGSLFWFLIHIRQAENAVKTELMHQTSPIEDLPSKEYRIIINAFLEINLTGNPTQ